MKRFGAIAGAFATCILAGVLAMVVVDWAATTQSVGGKSAQPTSTPVQPTQHCLANDQIDTMVSPHLPGFTVAGSVICEDGWVYAPIAGQDGARSHFLARAVGDGWLLVQVGGSEQFPSISTPFCGQVPATIKQILCRG